MGENNITHSLAYGSLIGAIRDHTMNPYEVDNDIMLTTSTLPPGVFQSLFDRGYIMFKHDVGDPKYIENTIWAMCKYSKVKREALGPWNATNYFPYTDVYPISFIGSYTGVHWIDQRVKKVDFADTFMYVPVDEKFIDQWMTARYG